MGAWREQGRRRQRRKERRESGRLEEREKEARDQDSRVSPGVQNRSCSKRKQVSLEVPCDLEMA